MVSIVELAGAIVDQSVGNKRVGSVLGQHVVVGHDARV